MTIMGLMLHSNRNILCSFIPIESESTVESRTTVEDVLSLDHADL
jgi:hypothetical protein